VAAAVRNQGGEPTVRRQQEGPLQRPCARRKTKGQVGEIRLASVTQCRLDQGALAERRV